MKKLARKPLTIAYFGCIDKKYSRNKTNIDGLREAGAIVHEVVVDVPVTPFNASSHLGIWQLVKRVLRKFLILPEIVRQWPALRAADVILVGYPGQFDVPFGFLVAQFLGKPLVFDPVILMCNALSNDIGVIPSDGWATRCLKAFERLVMNLPDLIIASTLEQKDFFTRQVGVPPERIAVAYLAADNHIYKPRKNRARAKNKVFTVVYYGLFTPLHGIPHIIEAARLTQKNKHIVFQMIGRGQLYEESRRRVDALGLSNIEFYPEVTETNALPLLQQADVFLGFMESNSTVLREIPNKVYQGLSLRTVVITSDSPAIRTVFSPGKNIVLVPPAHGAQLARAIEHLAKHPNHAQAIADQAYKLYVQRFTPKAVGVVLRETLTQLL